MMNRFSAHIKGHWIVLIAIILCLSAIIIQSCSSPTVTSSKKVDLRLNTITRIGEPISIVVEPTEPGISKIELSISSSDTSVSRLLRSYPYRYDWIPDKPGEYDVETIGTSIIDGKQYKESSHVTVFDQLPPNIEDIKLIPERPYVGDEVLLQLKVGSKNPKVDLAVSGALSQDSTIKPGYTYLRLGSIGKEGNVELFINTKTYYTSDATKLSFTVLPMDSEGPEIVVYADTFYSEQSNISVRVTLRDNVALAHYSLTFDGIPVVDKNINGTTYTEEVLIGPRDLGTHAINIIAYDREGNMSTFAKRIYVGGTALRFQVELSPAELIAGRTAVIAVIPQEKDVIYKRVVYLVDGKNVAEYPSATSAAVQLFTLWEIEEGDHYITVYAESSDGRAGIAETVISVRDFNGPRFVSLKANGVELSKSEANYVFPGLTVFELTVFDPGGINTSSKPRLLIREDEMSEFYRDLAMDVSDVSSDGRTVTFSVQTSLSLGYYYVSLMNVKDKSGNLMPDVGKFLLYVQ
ncbi:MAG: hypothetical protein WBJ29_02980 [Fervidobacterium sp.]|nr:hypothetical protein [Fervidobacterium sp.]HRD20851.1 hypothetical protein [Fervidobacterium sp.]